MKASNKKSSNTKAASKKATKKGYTPKETMRLALHEAAHFVVGWAVECFGGCIDIRPSCRRQCSNDPTQQILGTTNGFDGAPPFQRVLIALAGPVSDNWGKGNAEILDAEKPTIDRALESIKEGYPLHSDDGDWDIILRRLIHQGFDVTVPTQAHNTLLVFIATVQEILKLCDKQWQELTEHLIKHGRINLVEGWWESGNDWRFISNWDDEDGLPPKVVRDCVEKCRLAVDALPKAK